MAHVELSISSFSASPTLPLGSRRSILQPERKRDRAGKIANGLQNPDPDLCFIPCLILTFLKYRASIAIEPRREGSAISRDCLFEFIRKIFCVYLMRPVVAD